ncbi:MAG: 16S rRNA (cytosine(1402)-N(4))-methyltransferase RsmH, partial [Sciscionella sp.]
MVDEQREPTHARHTPVLAERIVELFTPAVRDAAAPAVLVDATLGLGGHTEALLDAFDKLTVLGLDRDPEAIALASSRLSSFGDRFLAVRAVYDELPTVLADRGIGAVCGVLFDLGVSSLQLDAPARGFAYAVDTPLDMRMDPTGGITAAEVLNTYTVDELSRVLRDYGEERFAVKIARAIVAQRAESEFTTSAALVELLYRVVPAATRRTGGHPAKRTFQALRIEVNSE